MFDMIQQRCLSYYDEIPVDTFPTIAKSAIFSFTITIIMPRLLSNRDLRFVYIEEYTPALITAGLAAVATLVHAILSPIFNRAFGNNSQINVNQELMKYLLVTALTGVCLSYARNQRIRYFVSINLVKSLLYFGVQIRPYLGHIANRLGVNSPDGSNSTYLVL